jgi:hypothetical protein
MKISKSVDVKLDREELERLNGGEPLRIPLEEQQFLNLYPPGDGETDA